MTLRAFLCVLCLSSASSAFAQEFNPPPHWPSLRTPHYTFRTNATKEQVAELADFMELVYKTYSAILVKGAPPKLPKEGNTVLLFSTRNEFHKATRMGEGVGAFYSPGNGNLVGWYHPVTMKPYFAHEGMHQFTDLTVPNFSGSGVPMWFTEGIADCIGNSVERGGKLYMCAMSGVIANMRLPVIHAMVSQNKHVPLEKLLSMNQPTFMANAGLMYPEAWSFCHFLMTYPKREDPSKQIPDGKYRMLISLFYEQMLARKAVASVAWSAAMQAMKVPSLQALEEEWKAYVLELGRPDPDAPFLGVRLDPKRIEEGIVVSEVVKDSPAEKAGIQSGDRVTKVGGQAVEDWNAFASSLKAKKPGDKLALVVKRDGKPVTLSIILDRVPPPSK